MWRCLALVPGPCESTACAPALVRAARCAACPPRVPPPGPRATPAAPRKPPRPAAQWRVTASEATSRRPAAPAPVRSAPRQRRRQRRRWRWLRCRRRPVRRPAPAPFTHHPTSTHLGTLAHPGTPSQTAGVPGSANSNRLKVRLHRFPASTAEVVSRLAHWHTYIFIFCRKKEEKPQTE